MSACEIVPDLWKVNEKLSDLSSFKLHGAILALQGKAVTTDAGNAILLSMTSLYLLKSSISHPFSKLRG